MEDHGADALSAEDHLSGPEFDGNGFDTNEGVMLLRMMETHNEPVSPRLQALLDNRVDLGWPSAQRQQSPLLMERPQSPGSDIAAFSFARPAQNGKPFSLQSALKRPASGEAQGGSIPDKEMETGESGERHGEQTSNAVPPRTGSVETLGMSQGVEDLSVITTERGPDQSENMLLTMPKTDTRPESRDTIDHPLGQETEHNIEYNQEQSPLGHEEQDEEVEASVVMNHERILSELGDSERRVDRRPSFECRDLERHDSSESRPIQNQSKVVKRRHSDKKKSTKRVSYAPSETGGQVSEEVLFHQLINRMKAREENEAVASSYQREMEANMAVLREENNAFVGELEVLSSKLQKRSAEAKAYKAQNDSWKAKLTKIKVFLNELGSEYQNLRGEAIHFKATRKTLDRERKDIADSLEEVKARLGTVSQTSLDQCNKLSNAARAIASLEEQLGHTREKAQYSQDQLVDEKKRSRMLEMHIQNCSRVQGKSLELVRTNQLEIMNRLQSAFEATSKNYESSHAVITSAFDQKLDDLLALMRTTTEKLSNNDLDVQQCREAICTFQSRLDTTARGLSEGIGDHSKAAEGMMRNLEEQFRTFKDSVGPGSTLLQQLSASEDRCDYLRSKLEETAPVFGKLGESVDGLQQTEVELGQQMETLETRLIEVRLPERFEDDYYHISQKVELESEIKQLALKLKSTEEDLKAQQLDNSEKKGELHEMTARAHQGEVNTAKLESQISGLQTTINAMRLDESKLENQIQELNLALKTKEDSLEAQLREREQEHGELRALTARAHQMEINAAKLDSQNAALKEKIAMVKKEAQVSLDKAVASSRDRCNADSDRRCYELSQEKTTIQMDAERARQELAELQRKLHNAEEWAEKGRKDLEATLAERQKRLEDAEASRADQVSNMAARIKDLEAVRAEQALEKGKREAEIEQLRKHEASLTAQQNSLRNQLDEARQKLNDYDREFMRTSNDEQRSRKALQDGLSALQTTFAKKEEDCHALQESLSTIQDQLAEREEDCRVSQSTLDVVRGELSGSKAENQDLRDGLLSLQDELVGSKKECHTFQMEIKTIQNELAANKEERQHLHATLSSVRGDSLDNDAARQALEDSLSSAQGTLAKNEDELQSMQKQLEEADTTRKNLESGKSKVKAELHALLKRVQESETGIKTVRDLLDRTDVAKLELSLPEALEHLEGVLTTAKESGPTISRREQTEAKTPGTSTRYFQAETTGNDSETPDEPKTPVGQINQPSPSKQAGAIVPFSSILQGLSPEYFSVAENELFDLSQVVAQTPDEPAPHELSVPARPEKAGFFTENTSGIKMRDSDGASKLERTASAQQASEQVRPDAPKEQTQVQSKGSHATRKVSFVTRKLTAESNGLQVPDSQEKNNESNVLESSLNGDHPRTNRWTYSKRQREVSTKKETASAEGGPQPEEQEARKKAKTSSTSTPVPQDKAASELYGRRKSPTRLASGSSGTFSNVPNRDQLGSTRGKRRSARRTRGDKYNARFSQGA